MVFVVGVIRSFFTPERTRSLLAGRRESAGNVLAALLGVVTPFCSCSAVPLFIGFVEAGIPLGVTLSFLISAPMVNEVALVLLFGLFGWKVAALYLGTGLVIAIGAGWVLGRMRLEPFVEPWVYEMTAAQAASSNDRVSFEERLTQAREAVREIVGKVWPYVVAGIAVGAGIHGYVPEGMLAGIMGRSAWWSVPAAVLLGVPMYSNAAGIIPVVQALLEKGAALGTVLAFMMAVIGLSLPKTIILRRVMKIQVLGTGCAKCKQLTANAQAAIAESGLAASVEKVEDLREIMKFGVMTTPALVIDGKVRSAGKVLSPADIRVLLAK